MSASRYLTLRVFPLPPLVRILLGRAVQIGVVALFVTLGTSLLLRLVPGDPAVTMLGDKSTPEALKALRHELGMDVPVLQQVGETLGKLLQGDLGTSFAFRGQEITTIIGPSLIATGTVAALAIVFSLLFGVPLGLWLALVRRSGADLTGRLITAALLGLPSFMAGLVLLYVVSLLLGLAPPGGWAGTWPANFGYVWLPAAALAVSLGSLIARTVRQAALEALGQPYIEAARTRGVPRYRIVFCHVLPNALLPVITLVGFYAGGLVSGAVTVETVFNLPGLGAELLLAMGSRDLPVVQGIALLTAISIVVFNLLADLLNIAVDPRLRRSR